MPVTGNKSTEEVQGGYKLWTGLGVFKVISINPTLEKIREKINPNAKDTAADYKGKDRDGNDYLRLDFHLASCDVAGFKGKIAFFLTAKDDASKDGKVRLIDKKGNYTVYTQGLQTVLENPKMDWMDKKSLRKAISGEAVLIDFLAAWLNVNRRKEDAQLSITDPKKMIKSGDVSELKEWLTQFRDNQVKLLCVVRQSDGKTYQDFYKGHFEPSYIKKVDGWVKALENQYTALKPEYKLQNGLAFSEYIGSTDLSSAESTPSSAAPATSGGYEDSEEVF